MVKSFFCFLFPLLVIFSQTSPTAGVKSLKRNPMKRRAEKLSDFQFHWHDMQPPVNKKTGTTGFGMINMIEDPLTEKPEADPKLLGRAQGLYGVASQGELGILMAMNFVFSTGKDNGSTLSIMRRYPVFHKVREMHRRKWGFSGLQEASFRASGEYSYFGLENRICSG